MTPPEDVQSARAELAWFARQTGDCRDEAQASLDLALDRHHAWNTGEFHYWLAKADLPQDIVA